LNILVAGGAGYIGTHTIIELIAKGHTPIVADMLSNSSEEALRRVEKITGQTIVFYPADCTEKDSVRAIFDKHPIDAVMTFAGHKAVGESVEKPLMYYRNNLDIALTLTEVMLEKGVKKMIFSSSCTVYGTPEELPLKETSRTGNGITNPYGWTKFMIEQILHDLVVSDNSWEITVLRYFNPIGAHESGLIGENPNGIPANILPYVSQVAIGKREKVMVFGDDYDTPDGTGVRDYIHIVDLAKGHVAALEHLTSGGTMGVYNLGTGRGVSVLELIHAFEQACGKTIPYEVVARRPGDIASAYADPTKASKDLGWTAEKNLDEACVDAWRWQTKNPNGFQA
jgi:UDP-glucose 4-epimerase